MIDADGRIQKLTRAARWRYVRSRVRWRRRTALLSRAGRGRLGVTSLATFPFLVAMSLAALAGTLERASTTPGGGELVPWPSQAEIALGPTQAFRADQVAHYAARFAIGHELAALIYDTARDEGLDPDLAFPLVKIESSFRQRAVSSAGAIGYTQVRPSTARWLDSTVTREKLFEPETNLRLGFRYLRMMLDRYDEDTRLALLAYNRGPGTVAALIAIDQDPSNGYASRVLGVASTVSRAGD